MFSHLQCIFKQFSKSEAEQQDRRLTISVLNESCVDSSCHFPVDLRFRRKIIRDRSGSPKNTSLALGYRRCRSISGRLTESQEAHFKLSVPEAGKEILFCQTLMPSPRSPPQPPVTYKVPLWFSFHPDIAASSEGPQKALHVFLLYLNPALHLHCMGERRKIRWRSPAWRH